MSGSDAPTTFVVRGGEGGIGVVHDRMRGLADDLDDLAERLRDRGDAGLASTLDADLLRAAVLAPVSCARAEAAVARAATAALRGAARWETAAVAIRATASGLGAADEGASDALVALSHRLGAVAGPAAVGLAALGLGALAATPAAWPALAAGRAIPEHLARRLGPVAVTHPGLVGPAVVAGAGAVDALAPHPFPGPLGALAGPAGVSSAAGLLASAYGPEAPPRVSPVGRPTPVAPPRGLPDLLDGVAAVGRGPSGAIAVDTLVRADGTRRHVVHLPGTDDMTTLPWTRDADARDLGTNLRLVAGDGSGTTYGRGVVESLGIAGVAPDEPVMMVGHSQGGLQAVAVAASGPPYDVRQVVSAGAPLGADPGLPPGVGLLALEHVGDPVPSLDGRPPPETSGVVTVTFGSEPDGPPDPVERHALVYYRDGAAAAEQSDHPSLVAHRRGLAADGFLDAVTAERRVLVVMR